MPSASVFTGYVVGIVAEGSALSNDAAIALEMKGKEGVGPPRSIKGHVMPLFTPRHGRIADLRKAVVEQIKWFGATFPRTSLAVGPAESHRLYCQLALAQISHVLIIVGVPSDHEL